ncbi:MAG: hypothetical protein EBX41_10340, partial [Chitinophagia bacterium]|nr:hypothetical protein [Chitinophagia bacterium]
MIDSLTIGGNYPRVNTGSYTAAITTEGWWTIGSYGSGRMADTIIVSDLDSSRHNYVRFHVTWSYGNGGITVVQSGRHGVSTIPHLRVLYNTGNPTYGGVKIQVYCHNPNFTLYVRYLGDQIDGWGSSDRFSPVLENTPSGWAEYNRIDNVNEQGRLASSGWVTSNSQMRAPVYYDLNDTSYYVDPHSTSDSALRIRGGALHGPNPTWGAYLLVG